MRKKRIFTKSLHFIRLKKPENTPESENPNATTQSRRAGSRFSSAPGSEFPSPPPASIAPPDFSARASQFSSAPGSESPFLRPLPSRCLSGKFARAGSDFRKGAARGADRPPKRTACGSGNARTTARAAGSVSKRQKIPCRRARRWGTFQSVQDRPAPGAIPSCGHCVFVRTQKRIPVPVRDSAAPPIGKICKNGEATSGRERPGGANRPQNGCQRVV